MSFSASWLVRSLKLANLRAAADLFNILIFKHLRNASMQPALPVRILGSCLFFLNASAPLSCSIYRDVNPSLCFLCESPLNQACIINVSSDLSAQSKCNQHQGTHTTCF